MIGFISLILFAGFFTAVAMRFIEPPVSGKVVMIVTIGVMALAGSCSLNKDGAFDPYSGYECSRTRFC